MPTRSWPWWPKHQIGHHRFARDSALLSKRLNLKREVTPATSVVASSNASHTAASAKEKVYYDFGDSPRFGQTQLEQEPRPFPLLHLPHDLLYQVVLHLDPFSRVAFRRTCRNFYHALSAQSWLTRDCVAFDDDDKFMRFPHGWRNGAQYIRHLQVYGSTVTTNQLSQALCEPDQAPFIDLESSLNYPESIVNNLVSLDLCITIEHLPGEQQPPWDGRGLSFCHRIEHLALRTRHVRSGSQTHFQPRLLNMKWFYVVQFFRSLRSFIFIDTTPEIPKRYLDKHELRCLTNFLDYGAYNLESLELSPTWRVDLRQYWLFDYRHDPKPASLHHLSAHTSIALALSYSVVNLSKLHVLSLQASHLGKYTSIFRRPLFTPYRFPHAHAVRNLKLTVTKPGSNQGRINWDDIARNFPDLEQIQVRTPSNEPVITDARFRLDFFGKLPKLTFAVFYLSAADADREPTQHTFRATRDASTSNVIELQHDMALSPFTQALRSSWPESCNCNEFPIQLSANDSVGIEEYF